MCDSSFSLLRTVYIWFIFFECCFAKFLRISFETLFNSAEWPSAIFFKTFFNYSEWVFSKADLTLVFSISGFF
jgi:hypothetical protein